MGFFDLDQVIEAFKAGKIDSYLADFDLNDLALIRHELDGYAEKHNRLADLKALILTIDNMINERREALSD
ncbi:MAG: hypothetical protein P9L99_19215 [Candidatus Lernaella stagnicola]|nr:hypothetical protein [Candidatus Lernaella stagnicola]